MTESSHFLRRASHWLWACVFCFGAGCGDGAGPPAVSKGPSPTQRADKVEANEKEPPAPNGFIFRPTFDTDEGEIRAGTAFPLRLPEHARPVIVTAMHLFGPGGGMSRDVPPNELPKAVKRLRLDDCFAASPTIVLDSEPLVIPEAAPIGESGQAGDIAAFWGPSDERVYCLEMSDATLVEGQSVWLVASLLAGAPADQRLHHAKVLGTHSGENVLYQYDNPKLSKQATSGAPIVDQAGRLVAVNLGGFEDEGQIIGVGNPVGRFRKFLEAAAQIAARR